MRVFGRMLYSLVAVGFFLLAFTYSRDLMLSKYVEEVFGQSLTDTSSELPKYYYFYSSIPDFHNDQPVIEIVAEGYEIYGYEVAKTSFDNNNNLIVHEYIYLLIYSETEDLSVIDYLYLENQTTEATIDINLQRFKTLFLLNAVNEEYGNVYIPKDDVMAGNYDRIYLVSSDDQNIMSTAFTIEESDFVIKDYIESFYDEFTRIPDINDVSDMALNNIYPNQTHVADDYVHIFYIAMGIYFATLIVTTYLVYFKKKKRHSINQKD
ncbi:MAG: hypothetical protein JEZ05_06050 [Tenericutes bacterium]|nr:hypothetical protein [Mycoplasmatota bacterium]